MARVLVTNGGPHTADDWATISAEQIVQIDPAMMGTRLLAAEKLKLAFAKVLVPHHAKVQLDERAKLSKRPSAYVDAALKDIEKAAERTPWHTHFSDPEVQTQIGKILEGHMRTSQKIERLWAAQSHKK
jgi:hypothetical protein